jgi:transcription termination/antitermination protein NusA
MNKEMLLLVIEALARQKDLEKEEVFTFLEEALATIIGRKQSGAGDLVYGEEPESTTTAQVMLSRETADLVRVWSVVSNQSQVEDPLIQLEITEAKKIDPLAKVGEQLLEPLESDKIFGRIDANQAKQIILRLVRKAERSKKADFYRKNGMETLLTGKVIKVSSAGVVIELSDGVEAIIPRGHTIPRENIHVNDYVKGYLFAVDEEAKGPFLHVSRSMPEMLVKLLSLEIPEIAEGSIEVKAAARDPGVRAKVIVKTHDRRIDPIGACVGVRGSRVQTISSELGGERVDIINWDEDPSKLVRNAVVPAQVAKVEINDEEAKQMTLVVDDDNLAMVIGRNGQNIRLASTATGWRLNVVSVSDRAKDGGVLSARERVVSLFEGSLGVDHEIAVALAKADFTRIDQVASASVEELVATGSFDAPGAEGLCSRAKAALLSDVLLGGDDEDVVQPDDDLLALDSVSEPLAFLLAKHGITNQELLAEKSVDELLEVVDDVSEKEAAKIIMEAREPWFNKDSDK